MYTVYVYIFIVQYDNSIVDIGYTMHVLVSRWYGYMVIWWYDDNDVLGHKIVQRQIPALSPPSSCQTDLNFWEESPSLLL